MRLSLIDVTDLADRRSGGIRNNIVCAVTMRRIIQAKIDRYRDLLQTETDATKRTIEMRLH